MKLYRFWMRKLFKKSYMIIVPSVLFIISIFWSNEILAKGLAGPYLAARQADYMEDFESSALYNSNVIASDHTNLVAMENLVVAYVALGQMDLAISVVEKFLEVGSGSYYVHLIALAKSIDNQDFSTALTYLESKEAERSFLLTELTKGWVLAGTGRVDAAVSHFDQLSQDNNFESFAIYHKALLQLYLGEYASAEAIITEHFNSGGTATRKILVVLIHSLLHQGRFEEANSYIKATFENLEEIQAKSLLTAVEEKRHPDYTMVEDIGSGVSEVFYTIAQILNGEESSKNTLVFARLAEFLTEDNSAATLLCADVLSRLRQYDLASRTYSKISINSSLHQTAEIGRADVLSKAGQREEAITVLRKLTQAQPESFDAFRELADKLRYSERYSDAAEAYTKALVLAEKQNIKKWRLYYARGMTFERLDRWDIAEADFRAALKLQPDQPYVLNYLGYSLVEKKIKLEEALAMIERAVSLRSDNGYIVDSLGWVLFRMNKYDEAVKHLERATELMPADPIINDHLGDGYWAVGRKREAKFQWRRALSFDPEDKEAVRIRKKLQFGLDKVMSDERDDAFLAKTDDG